MKNYKIIASDLDGTLLNDDGEISNENIDAINTFYNKGIAFVPCTGRTYSEIPENVYTDILKGGVRSRTLRFSMGYTH